MPVRSREFIWLWLLVAVSFSGPAFSQQPGSDSSPTTDAETSAPPSHDGHSTLTSDDDDADDDHGGMVGEHDGIGTGHHDHRVDHHDPAFLMYTHVLERGEWMIGYRYTDSYMGGNQTGTTPLSNSQASNAPGGSMYMMVPTSMTMEMHMVDIMRGITDDVTFYLMPTWTDDTMNMLMNGGTTFRMSNGGFSDLPFGTLWRVYHGPADDVVLNIGFSAPTGDINNTTLMPMGMGMSMPMAFPYTMQLGHGTWDALPGITYKHYWDRTASASRVCSTCRWK